MDTPQISELWLSENGSMAFFRMRRGLDEAPQPLLAHIVRHNLQQMRLLYAREQPSVDQSGPPTRCEVYRLGIRTAVVERDRDHLQMLIASNPQQHRSVRFHRIEPTSSRAARELVMFLCKLTQAH